MKFSVIVLITLLGILTFLAHTTGQLIGSNTTIRIRIDNVEVEQPSNVSVQIMNNNIVVEYNGEVFTQPRYIEIQTKGEQIGIMLAILFIFTCITVIVGLAVYDDLKGG